MLKNRTFVEINPVTDFKANKQKREKKQKYKPKKSKKMRITKYLALLLFACTLLTSCVSKKKYMEAEDGRWMALISRDSLQNLLNGSRAQCRALESDTAKLGASLRSYQKMLNNNLNENQKLSSELANMNSELAAKNAELAAKLKELEDRELTIGQLQAIINEQNAKVKDLYDHIKNALMGFSSDELTVREEGGKIYVAMSDKLLFESGKAVVNKQGMQALEKLAVVLKQQTEIDVYCEGHTDSIPIKTAVYKDNWDLSVIRATSVVRILTETYGVQPLQIQPCGRGEFKPLDSNATAEGRARNRRTEIIIAPKLDKLYDMLKSAE